MNRLNKTESAVFLYCRFSLFLPDYLNGFNRCLTAYVLQCFFIKSDVKNRIYEGKIFTTSNYSPGIVKKKSSFYCVLQPRFTFFYLRIEMQIFSLHWMMQNIRLFNVCEARRASRRH